MKLFIYTDGACRGNGKETNKGAYAYAVYDEAGAMLHSEGEVVKNTTNNIMEMSGVINALEYCLSAHPGASIMVYTDSKYVYHGMTEWVYGWQKRGWMTAAKKPVLNRELWERLIALDNQLRVNYEWVKGHATDMCNNYVDEFCNNLMDKA